MPSPPDILNQIAYHAEQIKAHTEAQQQLIKQQVTKKITPKQKRMADMQAYINKSFAKRSKPKNS